MVVNIVTIHLPLSDDTNVFALRINDKNDESIGKAVNLSHIYMLTIVQITAHFQSLSLRSHGRLLRF